MRLLFCGDVVGRAGRDVLTRNLPRLRATLDLDFVVVNGENAAHGFGITQAICAELFAAGADVITTGNHAWDQRDIVPYFAQERRLLRPINYPAGTPGHGAAVFEARGGRKVLVTQVMGRLYMEPVDDPFPAIDNVLAGHRLGGTVDAVVVDVHAEATSEKQAMGHHLDGRVSLVAGTHSHVPTADAWVLPGGTAYQTDAGMCGDYDSVIGMVKEQSIQRFRQRMPRERLAPALGAATLCAMYVETDDGTGLARRAGPLRLGGRLMPAWPVEGTAPLEFKDAAE